MEQQGTSSGQQPATVHMTGQLEDNSVAHRAHKHAGGVEAWLTNCVDVVDDACGGHWDVRVWQKACTLVRRDLRLGER